ncbi:uncharacterized protein LY89DRAFT_666625 [Mollisia scopiformis]|uniref:C2H2-type domain-containing protein n=1 Tax=Mollisia scopiformis TaxID=149040 RepID=A0A194XHY3_MOLSC|nr:uncharacterized protein LY89DRAFT_666625 [Mollisia scopiformis]KUJ19768.1 hypothetical protein LY89DRAFT_666625 [Mollisia scopiformis]
MNPTANNPSPPAGFTFFRNARGVFDCPVDGCGKSYKQPESLKYHISRSHVFPQDPQHSIVQTTTQSTPQYAPGGSPSPTLQTIQLSPNIATGGPSNMAMGRRGSQIHKVSATTSRTPSPLSQSQPLSIPHDDSSSEQQNWSQSITWPAPTVAFLKTLIIKHGLLGMAQTIAELAKLKAIFRDFYQKVDFPTYKPPHEDERLWLLFKSKVNDIQVEMFKNGEIYMAKSDLKFSKLSQSTLPANTPKTTTPPTTPTIPSDQHLESLRLWHSLDGNAQARLFRDQLRTSKNAQSLIYEWEEYCAEDRRKERTSENVLEQPNHEARIPSSFANHPIDSQVITPLETPPPPQPSKPSDLKSLIESRLRESDLKRQRAKEAEKALEEATASKKVRLELHDSISLHSSTSKT